MKCFSVKTENYELEFCDNQYALEVLVDFEPGKLCPQAPVFMLTKLGVLAIVSYLVYKAKQESNFPRYETILNIIFLLNISNKTT